MIWTDSFGEGTTLNKQKRADLLLVMVTFFWGASYYLTNLCLTDLQPMNLNAFRFLSAFAVLGVSTSKATDESYEQYNLFDQDKFERLSKLNSAIDKIRDKYGDDAIVRACFADTHKN